MERPLDAMGRPKKAAQASKANGATAKNKGKAVDVKKELFGGYSPGGSYTIKTISVRRPMAKGEVPDGEGILRLKIDMQAANMNLRDPAIYRVKNGADHPQTGTKWKVYPMYDYAHVLTDALEGITHSLCTLEFEDHRPLYDWILDNVDGLPARPRQIE